MISNIFFKQLQLGRYEVQAFQDKIRVFDATVTTGISFIIDRVIFTIFDDDEGIHCNDEELKENFVIECKSETGVSEPQLIPSNGVKNLELSLSTFNYQLFGDAEMQFRYTIDVATPLDIGEEV